MERAIGETERRRAAQIEHNEKHGIVPQGIVKTVADIMEGARAIPGKGSHRVAAPKGEYQVDTNALHTESDIWKQITVLEERMFESAKNLEFEEAANLRDEVTHLKRMVDGVI